MTKHIFDILQLIDKPTSREWLSTVGVRHDDRHGRSGFIGNDCHRLLNASTDLANITTRSRPLLRHCSKEVSVLRKRVRQVVACSDSFRLVTVAIFSAVVDPNCQVILDIRGRLPKSL